MKKWYVLVIAVLSCFWLTSCVSAKAADQAPLLVNEEFRFIHPQAGEVFLVWGTRGWNPLPEELRPAGTILKENVMHTPMSLEGDTFVARLSVPAWTAVDYGFLITKTRDGRETQAQWDASDTYQLIATQKDGVVEVESKLELPGTQ
jgi:hypothetical protein